MEVVWVTTNKNTLVHYSFSREANKVVAKYWIGESTILHSMASNTTESVAGRWKCEKCQKYNTSEYNTCRCGVRKGDRWCVNCQDIIYAHKKYCKCVGDWNSRKPADNMIMLNGDWICPSCQSPQFARRDKCRFTNCDGKRPSVSQASTASPTQAAHGPVLNKDARHLAATHLKGDWDCSACGRHQFARNTKCRDCGADKTHSFQAEPTSQSVPDKECVVCMDRAANAMLFHNAASMGHTCVCWECAEILQKNKSACPMCREPIDGIIRSF